MRRQPKLESSGYSRMGFRSDGRIRKMHKVTVRQEIVDRVLARRGRYHWFEELDPRRTALVVIDMQELFCAPGGPAEVAGSRNIVSPIKRADRGTSKARSPGHLGIACQRSRRRLVVTGKLFFNYVVSDKVRQENAWRAWRRGDKRFGLDLTVGPNDVTVIKNRYSAFTPGSSSLERLLRSRGIETLLIAGTKPMFAVKAPHATR